MIPLTNQLPNQMQPGEDSLENEREITPENPGGTAPDAETQSSAASSAGGRMTDEGSLAPEDPAEGAA